MTDAAASSPTWRARDVAAAVGLSYERFRKIWRDLPGFPPPFLPGRWDPAAVIAWKAARSTRKRAVAAAANTNHARPVGRLQRLRAS